LFDIFNINQNIVYCAAIQIHYNTEIGEEREDGDDEMNVRCDKGEALLIFDEVTTSHYV